MKKQYKQTQPKVFSSQVYKPKTPEPVSPSPTKTDYKRGYMKRYFLKRRQPSNRIPFEVDKAQYNSWSNRGQGIPQKKYQALVVKWRVRGPEETKTNRLGYPIQRGTKSANKSLLENVYEPEMSGITEVLGKNLLQYNKSSNADSRDR